MSEQLWAPWRLGYVSGATQPPPLPERDKKWLPGADQNCFVCKAVAESLGEQSAEANRDNYLAYRGQDVVVILNRFPYNNGHLLVSPTRHLAGLPDITDDVQLEMLQTITRLTTILEKRINAGGFNIGLNLGRVAGAGVPGHLHWHIVPRWNGDTNFMPVTANVNVLPQSLISLWEMLVEEVTQARV